MENDVLLLKSAAPINDNKKSLGRICIISTVLCAAAAIITGKELLLVILIAELGAALGWSIMNCIWFIKSRKLERQRFYLENKVPYHKLAERLELILSPMGVTIGEAAELEGCPVINFHGWKYVVKYNEDYSFTLEETVGLESMDFHKFVFNYSREYKRIGVMFGILAYHVQQVCDHYMEMR